MAITTLMATFVALRWKVNVWIVCLVNGSLLAIDLMFFTSTATKLFSGGWFPLLIAFVISLLMLTWRKGEELMESVRLEVRERADEFVARLRANPPIRVPGTTFALGRMSQGIPLALTQNLKHNHVMHERVFLVAVTMAEIPRVLDVARVTVIPIDEELSRVELCFGFMRPGVYFRIPSRQIMEVGIEFEI